ncbi:MAG TPA: hypothetical protein VFX15_02720 [Actinomycetes bacterium]|nr:hypothetical protein [Actinomycetes bacterium]
MKQITSTEFQKAYPRLTEPHEVTVLGRPIGRWVPITARLEETSFVEPTPGNLAAGTHPAEWIDGRPVTAVPKPGKKR